MNKKIRVIVGETKEVSSSDFNMIKSRFTIKEKDRRFGKNTVHYPDCTSTLCHEDCKVAVEGEKQLPEFTKNMYPLLQEDYTICMGSKDMSHVKELVCPNCKNNKFMIIESNTLMSAVCKCGTMIILKEGE